MELTLLCYRNKQQKKRNKQTNKQKKKSLKKSVGFSSSERRRLNDAKKKTD